MTYEKTLERLAQTAEVMVLTAENRANIRGLPASLGPKFIDFGICEQTMVGAAAGLALRGRIPVAHALATFLTMRAFEFIRTDVGIPGLPVILVGSVPGFLSSANGPTHQALEDVALMRGIPHIQVFCPADREELIRGLPYCVASRRPWYVRYYDGPAPVQHSTNFEIGRAEVLGSGTDVTLLTYGFMLGETARAKAKLEERGLSVGLLNLRSLKPIDDEAIVRAATESLLLVTVEDHFVTGGLYSIICETLVRKGVFARVVPLALEERWFHPGPLDVVLEHEGFTANQIAERVANEI